MSNQTFGQLTKWAKAGLPGNPVLRNGVAHEDLDIRNLIRDLKGGIVLTKGDWQTSEQVAESLSEFIGRKIQVVHFIRPDGWNIYAGVLPRAAINVRGDKNVLSGSILWADIDHVTPPEAGYRLSKSKLPHPSVIINSGHGVQCYWLLSEKLPPTTLRDAN